MSFLFSFRGTISRSRFWLGVLLVHVAAVVLVPPILWLVPVGAMHSWLILLLYSGVLWVFVAIHAKRLRDAGLSPWLCLLHLIPLGSLVVLLIAGFKPTAVERTGAPNAVG